MTSSIFSNYIKNIQKLNTIKITKSINAPLSFRFKCDINLDQISRKFEAIDKLAFQIMSSELPSVLNSAMNADVWYGGVTGDKDIIDSGELSRSLRISQTDSGFRISYDSDYAGIIHYGGYIVPYGNTALDKVYIRPKPWLESVAFGDGPIQAYDFRDAYLRAVSIIL